MAMAMKATMMVMMAMLVMATREMPILNRGGGGAAAVAAEVDTMVLISV
jgi:hypothetical protein